MVVIPGLPANAGGQENDIGIHVTVWQRGNPDARGVYDYSQSKGPIKKDTHKDALSKLDGALVPLRLLLHDTTLMSADPSNDDTVGCCYYVAMSLAFHSKGWVNKQRANLGVGGTT